MINGDMPRPCFLLLQNTASAHLQPKHRVRSSAQLLSFCATAKRRAFASYSYGSASTSSNKSATRLLAALPPPPPPRTSPRRKQPSFRSEPSAMSGQQPQYYPRMSPGGIASFTSFTPPSLSPNTDSRHHRSSSQRGSRARFVYKATAKDAMPATF